ncbi:hypothetical protein AGABI2DRAFT_120106 [Agaricus bisporus var. bisporus H97]|uniref:hypothetical protein n=1 Tax=Agaricus bisporus var. bisporus (strain H97 / ATCC MYA-4626 / FGSC 10389) TaxID=936046 RepID=UPI00029F6174|nr:hypothetical protein AGABI2DRAFT_120106 [Agaricus bisporus var. bisporus H97]EKV45141.1 hypothetical protein AGABI2DRAFT_120106 [Agaricus bisporus var. bisporus H97]
MAHSSRPTNASRPSFPKTKVTSAFEKEKIMVDSDEALEDVERVLRYELTEVNAASESFNPQSKWPEEQDFGKSSMLPVGCLPMWMRSSSISATPHAHGST